jgi:hypothetical protein
LIKPIDEGKIAYTDDKLRAEVLKKHKTVKELHNESKIAALS